MPNVQTQSLLRVNFVQIFSPCLAEYASPVAAWPSAEQSFPAGHVLVLLISMKYCEENTQSS